MHANYQNYFWSLWELLVFLAADLCSCKIILYVFSDLETEAGVGETEEGHKSITEKGKQQEKVVVCSDPQLDSRDSTEEQTPVAGVSGNHKAGMHESWFSVSKIFEFTSGFYYRANKWCPDILYV